MKNVNINLEKVQIILNDFETRPATGMLSLEWGFFDADKKPVTKVTQIKDDLSDLEQVIYDLTKPEDEVSGFMGVVEHPGTKSYIKAELLTTQDPLLPEIIIAKLIDFNKLVEGQTTVVKSVFEHLWDQLELGKTKTRVIGTGLTIISADEINKTPHTCNIVLKATHHMNENAFDKHGNAKGMKTIKKGEPSGSITLRLSSL